MLGNRVDTDVRIKRTLGLAIAKNERLRERNENGQQGEDIVCKTRSIEMISGWLVPDSTLGAFYCENKKKKNQRTEDRLLVRLEERKSFRLHVHLHLEELCAEVEPPILIRALV